MPAHTGPPSSSLRCYLFGLSRPGGRAGTGQGRYEGRAICRMFFVAIVSAYFVLCCISAAVADSLLCCKSFFFVSRPSTGSEGQKQGSRGKQGVSWVGGGGGRGCAMTEDPLMGLPQSPSDKTPYRRQPRRRGHDGSLAVEGTLRRPPRGRNHQASTRGRLRRRGEKLSPVRLGRVNRRPRKHCRAAVFAAVCNQQIR